ncbi:MAG: transcriptional regulator [Pseudonocardia sp.]
MVQVTWRAPDELVDRVRAAAAAQNRSVNEYLTRLAEAATDPELAGTEATRIRERLDRAGLLVASTAPRHRPDTAAVAAARAAAASGTPLADLVVDGRR